MSRKAHILNVSMPGVRIDLKLACMAIAACSAVWVEPNVSIRSVTAAEAIELRNQQAACRKPKKKLPVLAYAELPWLRYQPSVSDVASYQREQGLALQANHYARSAVR